MYFLVGFDTVLCYQELQNFRIAIVKVHVNLSVSLLALIYIYNPRHTECSNLTKARWA